jgi:hypothetical protein
VRPMGSTGRRHHRSWSRGASLARSMWRASDLLDIVDFARLFSLAIAPIFSIFKKFRSRRAQLMRRWPLRGRNAKPPPASLGWTLPSAPTSIYFHGLKNTESRKAQKYSTAQFSTPS